MLTMKTMNCESLIVQLIYNLELKTAWFLNNFFDQSII